VTKAATNTAIGSTSEIRPGSASAVTLPNTAALWPYSTMSWSWLRLVLRIAMPTRAPAAASVGPSS